MNKTARFLFLPLLFSIALILHSARIKANLTVEDTIHQQAATTQADSEAGHGSVAVEQEMQHEAEAKAKPGHEEGGHGEAGAHVEGDVHAQTDAHAEGEHHSNMYPLLFIIIALIIGAGTRHWLRKSPLPFTVSLLIIGLGLGAANRLGWFEVWHFGSLAVNVDWLHQSLNWAGKIDPHLILYVFLPTLIFEAAFAMDVHTFKKSFTNAFMLAVPGIILALILTAFIVIGLKGAGLGFAGWGWPLALLFGAVVSATDPVAVVALLKELGASKKLGTLIEGESLLNDGTAIVIFMVLLATITGAGSDTSPIVEFLKVALGGALVGVFFGWLTIRWVKKVFNDALIGFVHTVGQAGGPG